MDRSAFLKNIKAAFPELAADINAEGGALHMEMDQIRFFAERLIGEGDVARTKQLFALMTEAYSAGDANLKNAIDVSFVEPLEFSDTKKTSRQWAWDALPAALKALYIEFHGTAPGKMC